MARALTTVTDSAAFTGYVQEVVPHARPVWISGRPYCHHYAWLVEKVWWTGAEPRCRSGPASILGRSGIQSAAQPASNLYCPSAGRKQCASATVWRILRLATPAAATASAVTVFPPRTLALASAATAACAPEPRSMAADASAASTQLWPATDSLSRTAGFGFTFGHSQSRADGAGSNESASQLVLPRLAESCQHDQPDGRDPTSIGAAHALWRARPVWYSQPHAGAESRRHDAGVGPKAVWTQQKIVIGQRELSPARVLAGAGGTRSDGRSSVDAARTIRSTRRTSSWPLALSLVWRISLPDATAHRRIASAPTIRKRLPPRSERVRPTHAHVSQLEAVLADVSTSGRDFRAQLGRRV